VPERLWSLWDIMKAFNAALLGHAFGQLTEYAQKAAAKNDIDGLVSQELLGDISLTLAAAKVIVLFVQLTETKDAIARLEADMRSTEPVPEI
jgi:hypothetical protein